MVKPCSPSHCNTGVGTKQKHKRNAFIVTHFQRLFPPGYPCGPGHLHFIALAVVSRTRGEQRALVLPRQAQRLRLLRLAAQAPGQGLQRGQVLDLQIIQRNVAVLDGLAVELIKEVLEDVVDAHARQDVALLDGAVQLLWDEAFVAAGERKDQGKHFTKWTTTAFTIKTIYHGGEQ